MIPSLEAKLKEIPDEVIGNLLKAYSVPYDPKFKAVLFAFKPDLAEVSLGEFLTEQLPTLLQTPLVKTAMVALRKQRDPSYQPVQELMTQCPECHALFKVKA